MLTPSTFASRLRVTIIGPTMIFVVTTLALYLGIVYTFSDSKAFGLARSAIHAAILMMDALIAVLVLRFVIRGHRGVHESHPRWPSLVLRVVAYGSLLAAVLLHADYVLARYRGAEDGLTGSLLTLKMYLLAAQISYVFFITYSKGTPGASRTTPGWRLPAGDLLLLSVVAVPLVNYLAHNTEVFSWWSGVEYLGFFLLWPVLGFLVLYVLQRGVGAPPVAAPVVAGLALVYYSMPAVSSLLQRPVEALFFVHLGLALAVSSVFALVYHANPRLARTLLSIVALGSMAASAVEAGFGKAPGEAAPNGALRGGPPTADSRTHQLLSLSARRRPDVYLLVYDGYAAPPMMPAYGIDPAADIEYLKSRGFTVYEDAYSIHMASRSSMGSVLDMRTVALTGIGGNNTSAQFFRKHGYKTHLVLNSYLLQGSLPIAADVVFPPWQRRSDLGALYRGIAVGEFKADVVFQDSNREEWLAAKRAVLRARSGAPSMLYAHSGFPGHSQNSGTCLPDEREQYAARLQSARQEMRADVQTVLESNPDAILIIAGDHGPFLTGDCLYMSRHEPGELTAHHLADRYGAMLAVRWPGAWRGAGDIDILQDVFFAVAEYMLDDHRVWRSRIPAETVGFGGIPHGAVKDGMVMVGKDRGRRLF